MCVYLDMYEDRERERLINWLLGIGSSDYGGWQVQICSLGWQVQDPGETVVQFQSESQQVETQ